MRNNVSGRMRRIHTRVNPLVYADDAGAVALGFYDADGRTAAAVKDYDGMRSVFYGGLALDPTFVRHFARKAGCTIYIDSDDVVYGNHAYLVLHAAQDGDKRLYVGQTVREAYSRRLYRPDADGYITRPCARDRRICSSTETTARKVRTGSHVCPDFVYPFPSPILSRKCGYVPRFCVPNARICSPMRRSVSSFFTSRTMVRYR